MGQNQFFFFSLFFLCFSCFLQAQVATEKTIFKNSILTENIEDHVFSLASPSFEGRNNSTKGNEKARNYITTYLQDYNIEPANGESYNNPFTLLGSIGTNILGVIPGQDPELSKEYVLISAHYDHLGVKRGIVYPGANDNAAGCAAVLEISRVLAKNRHLLKRSVLIAFWDAEEDMMKGSLAYTTQPIIPLSQIACVVDMDLIGRPLLDRFPKILFVFGTEYSPVLRENVLAATPGIDMDVKLPGTDLIGPRCDYTSFWLRKIPFLFLTRGQQQAYHQPYDIPETIDYKGLHQVTCLAITIATNLINAEKRPQYGKANYSENEAKDFKEILDRLQKEKNQPLWVKSLLRFCENRLNKVISRNKMRTRDRWMLRAVVAALLLESYRRGSKEKAPKPTTPKNTLEEELDRELDSLLEDFGKSSKTEKKVKEEEDFQDLIQQFEDEVADDDSEK